MQIATLSYQYEPKDNSNGENRNRLQHRQTVTTIASPRKKIHPRQSFISDLTPTNVPLPPIMRNGKRPSSIRIKGNNITSSKFADTSLYSYQHRSRSHSRQSIRSDLSGQRSRSVTPTGMLRSSSKLARIKFGHPVKLRSADFYGPNQSEAELRLREDLFVNDSIRSATQSHQSTIIPHYDPLDDPHLRHFFKSPVVLDVLRKTLNSEHTSRYKRDEKLSKLTKLHKRSSIRDSNESLNHDYQRIVTKGSSGYAKLNGYDCIPTHSPARNYHRRRSSTVEPTLSNIHRSNTMDSYIHRSTAQDKYHMSADGSFTSAITSTSSQIQNNSVEKRSGRYEKAKKNKFVPSTSSSVTQPIRHLVEATRSSFQSVSLKTNDDGPENRSEVAVRSSVSQD